MSVSSRPPCPRTLRAPSWLAAATSLQKATSTFNNFLEVVQTLREPKLASLAAATLVLWAIGFVVVVTTPALRRARVLSTSLAASTLDVFFAPQEVEGGRFIALSAASMRLLRVAAWGEPDTADAATAVLESSRRGAGARMDDIRSGHHAAVLHLLSTARWNFASGVPFGAKLVRRQVRRLLRLQHEAQQRHKDESCASYEELQSLAHALLPDAAVVDGYRDLSTALLPRAIAHHDPRAPHPPADLLGSWEEHVRPWLVRLRGGGGGAVRGRGECAARLRARVSRAAAALLGAAAPGALRAARSLPSLMPILEALHASVRFHRLRGRCPPCTTCSICPSFRTRTAPCAQRARTR